MSRIWIGPPIRATRRTGLEVAEGEFEAEGEEEERYADFGEKLDLMDLATVGPAVCGPTRTPAAT